MVYEYNDVSLYYETRGDKDPVILLHGWGQDHHTFDDLTDFLSNKFKVYLIDLPSFGKSSSKNALSIKELSNMLSSFIKDHNIIKPIIIGHSYGGRIAIEYASINKNISKLILVDSAGIRRKVIYTKLKVLVYKIKKRIYSLYKSKVKYYTLISSSGSSDYKKASLIQKEMITKAVRYNQKKILKKIKCETLIIFGRNDEVTPLIDGKIMNKKIKRSGLCIIDNANHFSYLDNPYQFYKVLDCYLEVTNAL